MKNVWNKCKWAFLLLINALPFVVDLILYHGGAPSDLFLFLPVFAGLTVLNYRSCPKALPYLLYQTFMLICIICDSDASTYLYYHNISDDGMTLAIGTLMTLAGAGINIVVTVITTIVKVVSSKKRGNKHGSSISF